MVPLGLRLHLVKQNTYYITNVSPSRMLLLASNFLQSQYCDLLRVLEQWFGVGTTSIHFPCDPRLTVYFTNQYQK